VSETGASGIIDFLGAIAALSGIIALVWYMCRSAFNWRKLGELAGFLFISGFIFWWLTQKSLGHTDTYSITCNAYGDFIKDCNGWLFTTKSSYASAEKIKALISESSLAKGQQLIAASFIIILVLVEYSKAIAQGGLKALFGVAVTMIITYIILSNLSEIQTQINYYTDFLISFGRYNHGESYNKLNQTFLTLRDLKIKFDAFDMLQIESDTAGRVLGSILTFILEILFGCLSFANVVLYAVQTLLLAFIPSTLAMSYLTGSYQISKPLVLIGYGASSRAFIVAQMGAIYQLNIPENFGEISRNTIGVWIDVGVSVGVVTACLVMTLIGMSLYIFKLIFNEILQSRAKEIL
jgi:hypothetical protein